MESISISKRNKKALMEIRKELNFRYYNQALTYLLRNQLPYETIYRLREIQNKNAYVNISQVVHQLIAIAEKRQTEGGE